MSFYNNLCPGCMNEVGDSENCPFCGFSLKKEQSAPFLAYSTVLAGKYVIGDVLEQNGEGVTYLGLDTITNNCVRIREFLPTGICNREITESKISVTDGFDITYKKYRSEFLSMWHNLMKLRNMDSMITVLDVFEANDTAYAVAEADGSQTLSDYLAEKGGTLDWDTVTDLIFPVMDAIEAANNAGIVHGAISPDTLFLCGNGKFKPWGWSIPEERKTEGTLDADIRPGYAAIEQYGNTMELTSATDVYGFVSVLFKCVTGSVAIDAEIRSKEDTLSIPAAYARELPDYVLAAFIGALQVLPTDRTSDMKQLKKSFTREAFEMQKKRAAAASGAGESLVDPLSGDANEEEKPEEKKIEPIIVNGTPVATVVKKEDDTAKKTSAATMIILSASIVAVMVIFFVCLSLTGIVSFNVGSSGSTSKVVEIPDFKNYTKNDPYITQVAEKYGLYITLKPASSSTVASGVVFEQDITPGTKVARGSTLTLTYSKGVSTVTLPNFTGMTFTETVYYLGKLNLSYNIVEKDNTGSQSAGQVATMTPAAGSVVYEGTEITLEVWGDPPVATTPSSPSGTTGSGSGGSQVTSSSSILDSIFGSLSDSVSGLGSQIQSFFN